MFIGEILEYKNTLPGALWTEMVCFICITIVRFRIKFYLEKESLSNFLIGNFLIYRLHSQILDESNHISLLKIYSILSYWIRQIIE